MKLFKHKRSGDMQRVRDSDAAAYAPEDWDEMPDPGPGALPAEEKRKAAIRAMDSVERYDAIMAAIQQLADRVTTLERRGPAGDKQP